MDLTWIVMLVASTLNFESTCAFPQSAIRETNANGRTLGLGESKGDESTFIHTSFNGETNGNTPADVVRSFPVAQWKGLNIQPVASPTQQYNPAFANINRNKAKFDAAVALRTRRSPINQLSRFTPDELKSFLLPNGRSYGPQPESFYRLLSMLSAKPRSEEDYGQYDDDFVDDDDAIDLVYSGKKPNNFDIVHSTRVGYSNDDLDSEKEELPIILHTNHMNGKARKSEKRADKMRSVGGGYYLVGPLKAPQNFGSNFPVYRRYIL